MRVTTANTFERGIDLMQRRAAEMADAQERLISGKRILRASDDPSGAAQVERALAREARADANQRVLEASRNAMALAEGALGDVTNVLRDARTLVVQAGNPVLDDASRRTLGDGLRSLRQQILDIANRDDGTGGWIFGAQGSAAPPFVDAVSGVLFRGAPGQAQAASSEPLALSADGDATFLRALSGNGVFVTQPGASNGPGAWIDNGAVSDPSALTGDPYQLVFTTDPVSGDTTYAVLRDGVPTAALAEPFVSGKAIVIDGMSVTITGTPSDGDTYDLLPASRDLSVFEALDRLADEIALPQRSGPQRTQVVQAALRDLDALLANVNGERARMGEVLRRTDAVEQRIADARLLAQTERSGAEDVDMVQAVSDFSTRQSSYDAALKAYSMVQKLSLFEYIR